SREIFPLGGRSQARTEGESVRGAVLRPWGGCQEGEALCARAGAAHPIFPTPHPLRPSVLCARAGAAHPIFPTWNPRADSPPRAERGGKWRSRDHLTRPEKKGCWVDRWGVNSCNDGVTTPTTIAATLHPPCATYPPPTVSPVLTPSFSAPTVPSPTSPPSASAPGKPSTDRPMPSHMPWMTPRPSNNATNSTAASPNYRGTSPTLGTNCSTPSSCTSTAPTTSLPPP